MGGHCSEVEEVEEVKEVKEVKEKIKPQGTGLSASIPSLLRRL
jgi:hypothetical protein